MSIEDFYDYADSEGGIVAGIVAGNLHSGDIEDKDSEFYRVVLALEEKLAGVKELVFSYEDAYIDAVEG